MYYCRYNLFIFYCYYYMHQYWYRSKSTTTTIDAAVVFPHLIHYHYSAKKFSTRKSMPNQSLPLYRRYVAIPRKPFVSLSFVVPSSTLSSLRKKPIDIKDNIKMPRKSFALKDFTGTILRARKMSTTTPSYIPTVCDESKTCGTGTISMKCMIQRVSSLQCISCHRHHQCWMHSTSKRRTTGTLLFSATSDSHISDNQRKTKDKVVLKTKKAATVNRRTNSDRPQNTKTITKKVTAASRMTSPQNLDTEKNNMTIPLSDSEKQLYQELVTLVQEIINHDNLYYNYPQSTTELISDDIYDSLVSREEYICTNHPNVYKQYQNEYPTISTRFSGRRVGSSMGYSPTIDTTSIQQDQKERMSINDSIYNKRQHLRPMLSLDNIHNKDQLAAWIRRIITNIQNSNNETTTKTNDNQFVESSAAQQERKYFLTINTEPKLDGLSLNLRYKRRMSSSTTNNDVHPIQQHMYDLEWACTRGDGQVGTDVTVAVKQGRFVPLEIRIVDGGSNIAFDDATFEVRGEVILPRSEFNLMKSNMTKIQQEVQMTRDTLNTSLNSSNKSQSANTILSFFSNPRNAASGILLRKYNENDAAVDDTIALRSKLRFYAYELVLESNANPSSSASSHQTVQYESYMQVRQVLQSWNFTIPQPFTTSNIPLDCDLNDSTFETYFKNQLEYYDELRQWRENQEKKNTESSASSFDSKSKGASSLSNSKWKWDDYDVDGCVHKVGELQYHTVLGTTTRAPKWAIAHKFPAVVGVTRLRSIEVQVGRTGALTPVAFFDPIVLNGVTIQRATLHNFNHMQKMLSKSTCIDRVVGVSESSTLTEIPKGTPVIVRRAGDVIPQVISRAPLKHTTISSTATTEDLHLKFNDNTTDQSVTTEYISLLPPTYCPACGSPVVFMENAADKQKLMTNTKSDRLMTNGKKKSLKIEHRDESIVSTNNLDTLFSTSTLGDDAAKNSSGRIARCSGPSLLCPPQAIGALQQAFSRDAMDITGLSEARIRQLKESNLLNMPYDLFSIFLDERNHNIDSRNEDNSVMNVISRRKQIAKLDGWGEKSVNNLGNVVNRVAVDGITLSRYIYSLNIRNVGVHVSSLLATIYQSVDEFLIDMEQAAAEAVKTNSSTSGMPTSTRNDDLDTLGANGHFPSNVFARLQEETEYTKGIGPVVVSALYDFAQHVILLDAARRLTKCMPIRNPTILQHRKGTPDSNTSTVSLPFAGMSVVFTGTISNEVSRADAQKYAIEYLGAVSTPNRITKLTNVLVLGTSTKTGGDAETKKRQQALQYGTTIMDAAEFISLMSDYKNDT